MTDARMARNRVDRAGDVDGTPVGRARDKSTGPARPPAPPFEHPNKMDVKSGGARDGGKRASGSDKATEPKQGGDAARKAQEWAGGPKGAKGAAKGARGPVE